jgi:hypothetical protein
MDDTEDVTLLSSHDVSEVPESICLSPIDEAWLQGAAAAGYQKRS